jgi:hypothetical protein
MCIRFAEGSVISLRQLGVIGVFVGEGAGLIPLFLTAAEKSDRTFARVFWLRPAAAGMAEVSL